MILSVKSEKCCKCDRQIQKNQLLYKKQSYKIIIVAIGCLDDEIDATFLNRILKQKAKGMISSIWRKLICKEMIYVNCCKFIDEW